MLLLFLKRKWRFIYMQQELSLYQYKSYLIYMYINPFSLEVSSDVEHVPRSCHYVRWWIFKMELYCSVVLGVKEGNLDLSDNCFNLESFKWIDDDTWCWNRRKKSFRIYMKKNCKSVCLIWCMRWSIVQTISRFCCSEKTFTCRMTVN